MDIKDFRKFVNDSPIKDKLRSLKTFINYSKINSRKEFNGIESIYKFILEQVIGWNQIEKLPEYLNYSKIHFESLKSNIIGLTTFFNENNISQFDYQWSNFVEKFSSEKTNNSYIVFLYDAPETDFILKVAQKNISSSQGAIDFLIGLNLNINNNKEYLTGVLYAYEFKNQTESEILQRSKSEKISLGQIRTKYNEYIVEAEQQLNSNLSDAKENLINHFETVDKLKEEKNKNYEEWFKKVDGDYIRWSNKKITAFEDFFKESQESIKNNEDLYREKLRLEAPAKYWKDRADKLKKESEFQMDLLIRISLFGSGLLFIILLAIGNNYYSNIFNDTIKGIKWSLILITIVSLFVFIIRILAKLYMSSLHLSRDAEEREQLTHFYLALKKDTTIEPEERQLILQSLFSRADTGLLKEDSSPTMPTSIIERFTGK